MVWGRSLATKKVAGSKDAWPPSNRLRAGKAAAAFPDAVGGSFRKRITEYASENVSH